MLQAHHIQQKNKTSYQADITNESAGKLLQILKTPMQQEGLQQEKPQQDVMRQGIVQDIPASRLV